MYSINLARQILKDMWAHKLRSLLALFGIIWGTLTVVLLLALGQGFYQASRKNVMQITDGTFFVIPNKTDKNFKGTPKGQPIKIKADVIANLPNEVPEIQYASPILRNSTNISYAGKQTNTTAYGVTPSFEMMRKMNLTDISRFVNPYDIKQGSRVAILGYKLEENLFGEKSAVGKVVNINGIPFSVIGVTETGKKSVYDFYKDNVIIPYTTFISIWGNIDIPFFVLHPKSIDDLDNTEMMMRSYFAHKYHFDPSDKVALKVFNTTKMFTFFKWFFFGIQIFLGACGALTLGVGCLGVANIMFLIVTERTKEIGLRMAVGARDWQVMMQILLEALIIVGIGGLIGFLIASTVTEILFYVKLPEWMGKPTISYSVTIATISILAILGVLSGFFPARRASRMDPVEALNFR